MKQSARPLLPTSLPLLRFKGDRNYLHGTDIFVACLEVLSHEYQTSDITNIDIVFHSLAKAALVLCPSASHDREPKVQLTCIIDGIEKRYVLLESDTAIRQRIDYPEHLIVAATDINLETSSATSTAVLPFTNIERWVAMVKALHVSLYPRLSGRWLFVRGTFSEYPDFYGIDVQHKAVLRTNFNNRLTRTELFVDERHLGDVFFSLQ